MKYDIFISYRRDGGEYTAKILHEKLMNMGYSVFFDVESLRSGKFNTALFEVIDNCKDFLVVLSPQSLDRCANEEDWVRLEIAHALKKKKNVVPVMLRGFSFPEKLPEDIEPVRFQNGIEASTEFFDAFIARLGKFLLSKPGMVKRIIQNSFIRKVIPLFVAFLLTAAIIAGGVYAYHRTQNTFPVNKEEKNILSEVIYYTASNYSQANAALLHYEDALDKLSAYFEKEDKSGYDQMIGILDYTAEQITNAQNSFTVIDSAISDKIDRTILPKADILAVPGYLKTMTEQMLSSVDFMKYLAGDTVLSKDVKAEWVSKYKELLDTDKDTLFYCLNDMLKDASEDSLKELKSEILPQWTYIYTGQAWLHDETEIKGILDRTYTKQTELMADIAAIVGNENIKTEEAESNLDKLKETTEAVQETDEELARLKEEAKEKFKPLSTDDPELLWGKMLRFNSLKMYDMCIECLNLFLQKADDENAGIYVPAAIHFFEQIEDTGIDYGCMVAGYEPDKPINEAYEIGDILIEVNGQKITTLDDFATARGNTEEAYSIKVLRFTDTSFQEVTAEAEPGLGGILFYDMCEILE